MEYLSENLTTNAAGHLALGGADVPALAKEYGTPLYLMDEGAIRKACRAYTETMRRYYQGDFLIAYASKAFCASYMYRVIAEEGMGADVVSGGELYTAHHAGFPMDRVYFHGNNKTAAEIRLALEYGVCRFVVDNEEELVLLNQIAGEMGKVAQISFRIKPGIDAHTHEFIQTGKIDSKFGVALENGEAMAIIGKAAGMKNVEVKGVHCHIGSQIFELEPFALAAQVMMRFIYQANKHWGINIGELNLGGGFGIRYVESNDPPALEDSTKVVIDTVTQCAQELGMELPRLVMEPGRSIVASSGVTVYTVGSVKEIPNIRTYVSVDGGMTDNPRYALYEAAYEMLLPERPEAEKTEVVTVAGRCCESGDLVGRDIALPPVKAGDLLCVLATGAYNYSMASNYNRVPRPAVVMVRDGEHKLIVRRESYEDLIRNDLV